MKLLALETAGDICSVALLNDDVCFERSECIPQQHGQVLLDWVQDLLTSQNLTCNDLSAICYSCGPGSFTGVRMGASVMQGIAVAADIPGIAVPSLQVIAQGSNRKYGAESVLIVQDARMEELYLGCYQLNDAGVMTAVKPDWISKYGTSDVGLTNQFCLVTKLPESVFPRPQFTSVIEDDKASAIDVLFLAKTLLMENTIPSLDQALPIYLQKSIWKKRV